MFTYFVKYTTGLVSNNSYAAPFFLTAIKGINASLELFGMLNFFLRPAVHLKTTDEV